MEPGEPNAPVTGPLWKTRLCNFHAAGGCRSRSQCPFAHGEADLRPSPDFERTSVCPTLLRRGQCDRPRCRYAHHAEELRVQEGLLKTRMCAFYQKHRCIVGEACRFAHSEREVQEALAKEALATERTAAQRLHQPPPPAVEPAAPGRSQWLLRRSAFVCPRDAEAVPAQAAARARVPDEGPHRALQAERHAELARTKLLRAACDSLAAREPASGPRAGPRQPTGRPGQQASPRAPGAADDRAPLTAFSLTAPPGLLEFPARVSDCKVVIDAGLTEIEGMVLDIEEEVIAGSAPEPGLPRKVPLPAPYSSQLLARVVTLEEEIAELATGKSAAPPRSQGEAPRCACGAELRPSQRFCSACGLRAPVAGAPLCLEAALGAGPAEIEGTAFDIGAEEVIAGSVPLESGLPQKVPLPAPCSGQLLARAVTPEGEIAEPAPREPAAPSRSQEQALRCVCGAELSFDQRFCSACGATSPSSPRSASAVPRQRIVKRLRKEALVPKLAAPPGVVDDAAAILDIEDDSLVSQLTKGRFEPGRRLSIGVAADLGKFDLDDGAGGGGGVRAVASRSP